MFYLRGARREAEFGFSLIAIVITAEVAMCVAKGSTEIPSLQPVFEHAINSASAELNQKVLCYDVMHHGTHTMLSKMLYAQSGSECADPAFVRELRDTVARLLFREMNRLQMGRWQHWRKM